MSIFYLGFCSKKHLKYLGIRPNIEKGIKVSQAIYENRKSILSLPFYGIEALMKNVDSSLSIS